jgi:HD-GYP domain-containing protein (c-di-GMP phosphodiesterase class II)
MTARRPYKRAMSADQAVAELARCSGTQFDPGVVAAFRAELAIPARGGPRTPSVAPADDHALSVTVH